ncbi:hypothetical protein [Pseudomonas sp. NBRC 111119]|uniref:hypothetical protein n=1 Tax=Pseudomonas sp. NBRC 111119 TaxID=1661034 RepID=UPI000760F0C0|nr:hypothetical protein [Pseudomonas sp. NBRC 111119]
MMPDDALRFTRALAALSITVLILGPILALYVLQSPTTSPVKISGILAFAVLGLTNLISLILNAVYWFIRREPKWLSVMLLVQAGVTVVTLIPFF